MPRNGHRHKGAKRLHSIRAQHNDDWLDELRDEIYRRQAERRRADEEWHLDELDARQEDGRDEW